MTNWLMTGNWETQTMLAATSLGTEGIARMLENRETQTGGGGVADVGRGRSPIRPTHHRNALPFGKPWKIFWDRVSFRTTQLSHVRSVICLAWGPNRVLLSSKRACFQSHCSFSIYHFEMLIQALFRWITFTLPGEIWKEFCDDTMIT